MRILFVCMSLVLLGVSGHAVAKERQSKCGHYIPPSRNFVVSGALLRKTVYCLEGLIAEVKAENAIAAKQKAEQKPLRKAKLNENHKILSSTSIQIVEKDNKKHVMVSFEEHSHQKDFEVMLN